MRPTPLILVAGTHSTYNDWWMPGSRFARAVPSDRCVVVNGREPYEWTTSLDGVLFYSRLSTWRASARYLKHFAGDKLSGPGEMPQPVNIIAHSHGGNVVALAAALPMPLRIKTLVTMGTPVRKDMMETYRIARANIERWVHLHSDWRDLWQWFGAAGQRLWHWTREMPFADENIYEPVGHGGFYCEELWTARKWWDYL